MKKLLNYKFLILFFFLPASMFSQDITGIWKGELVFMDSVLVRLPYEIAVSENKGKISGYSRIIFTVNGKDEAGMQDISIKMKDKEIVIEDEGFIEHNFAINPSKHVKKTMLLTLSVSDTEMIMKGDWSTNRTRYYTPRKGTTVLKRKVDFKTTAIFKRLDTLKLVEKLSFIQAPTIPATALAVVSPPVVEKKTIPETPKPEEVPDLLIPPINNASTIIAIAVVKKPQPSLAKISSPSKQKKAQMDALSKTVIKYTPKAEPIIASVAVAPKPAPIAAVVTAPKPEKKTIPTPPVPKPVVRVAKTTTPPVEKKPVEIAAVAVAVAPKPAPEVIIAPSITQGAAEVNKRTTKSDQTFYFEKDSLVLTLYDNGEVDGDTVTVLMNGGIVFSKQGLSTLAQTKTVYIPSKSDSVNLVMYAESLGEIPPNTGLMIIMDGEKRYEVRFSADLKSNAGIILRRRKKEQ